MTDDLTDVNIKMKKCKRSTQDWMCNHPS